MVIIRVQGGLGNQLYQYAFGQYIANKFNLKVKYDTQLKNDTQNFTNRALTISELGLSLPIATSDEVKNITKIPKNIGFYRIKRKIFQKFPYLSSCYAVQNSNPHLITFELSNDVVYYDGYWQSNQIVEEVLPFIKEIIGCKRFQLGYDVDYVNAVSIHVRRGDYVNIKRNSNIFSVLELDYFNKAIKYLKNFHKDLCFYIFSDDIAWAKENFKGENFIFIEGGKPIDDFLKMSNCKYNIISNSTFSAWAAYLNNFEDKIVIYPSKWYKNKNLNQNLSKVVLKEWVGL